MRSAVYYPSTQVRSRQIMRNSLLLWDELHTIVPKPEYAPTYGDRRDMAEARVAVRLHRHHGADPGRLSAGVAALGLPPPGVGIAVDLDSGQLAGIGHALQIGRQLGAAAGGVADIDGRSRLCRCRDS